MAYGYSGISFPFRFGGKGGVETSTTSATDFSHIKESIAQIVLTTKGERFMELEFGSEINKQLFTISDDELEISILKFYIEEAITKYEPRVKVININAVPSNDGEDEYLIVEVTFEVTKYLKNDTVTIKL